MENHRSGILFIYRLIGALIGWLAVCGQFVLILLNRKASIGETIIRFFSFFTILTNILVACCFTSLLLAGLKKAAGSRRESFLTRPSVLSAVTVYILVVGIVYNLVLRFIWAPVGWQMIVDEALHSVIPALFFLYWLFFVPKKGLDWKGALAWMGYPSVYLILIIVRGSLTGYYPYPFIDVPQLGFPRCLLNVFIITLLFLVLSLALVALGKLMHKRKSPE